MHTVVCSVPPIMSTLFPRILATAILLAAGCSSDPSSSTGFFGFARRTPSQPTDELNKRQQRQLTVFASTVRNPSADIDPQTRRGAAQELIAMNSTEATESLADALGSGEPVVVMAVIDAMENSEEPVEGLLPAAAQTLQSATGERLEKLSLVLPRYGPEALTMVASLAQDSTEPPARRIGPIYALAAFRSRESAMQLMALIDEERLEPPEITVAAGVSLERLTGLPYGDDAAEWRRWWDRLKDEPIENWLRIMVLHLNTRTSDLEREIIEHDQERQEIARRLAETLRELFLTFTPDEQIERLPVLLDDPLPPVRAFALGRVERILRDSPAVPDSVQVKVAERLADPDEEPASRLQAAQLLNDLNHAATAELVMGALDNENDPAIALGYLEILARRTMPGSAPLMLLWLDNPTAGEAAADALWSALNNGQIEDDAIPTTRRAAQAAFAWRPTASHARLLGAVGEESDRAPVILLLDNQDPAMRRAAAEGLSYAGVLEPLMDRVGDQEIYPYVIRLVAGGPADVATVRSLAGLAPPENHKAAWTAAILEVSGRLTPSDLIAADTMLATIPHVSIEMRATILENVAGGAAESLSIDQRSTLLIRLAELYIALGAPDRACDTLTLPNGTPMTPAFANAKFQAAVMAERYDDAADLNSDVVAWIALLNKLTDDYPGTATAVHEEIIRRFPTELEGDAADLFRAAEERLTQATASADSPTPVTRQ